MRIADVLRNKGAAVATITPETSVAGLLTELTVHNIGAMVVVSQDGLVGIVSERDVVRKLHELGTEILHRPVSEIMTTVVVTSTITSYASETLFAGGLAWFTHRRLWAVMAIFGGALVGGLLMKLHICIPVYLAAIATLGTALVGHRLWERATVMAA